MRPIIVAFFLVIQRRAWYSVEGHAFNYEDCKMKSGFLEKLIGRLGRIDPEEVQNYLLRLAQEKGFLETIFNSIQEGIIVTDSSGRITYVNDAACEIFGLDAETSIGKRLD